jgi:biopolymer transport protein ExbB
MNISLIEIFNSGGLFMWPILLLSVMAAAIILERVVTFLFFHINTGRFVGFIKSGGKNGKPGIKGLDISIFLFPKIQAVKVIEERIQLEFDRLGKIIDLLSGIGSIAPLLGFMGTVSGMIVSFQSIAQADKVSVKLVAEGISQALITTGFGLAVAIACSFAEQLFRFYMTNRAHMIEEELTFYSVKQDLPECASVND